MCIGGRKSGFGRLSNPADSALSTTTRNRVKSLRSLAFHREVEVYFRYGGTAPIAVVLCCVSAPLIAGAGLEPLSKTCGNVAVSQKIDAQLSIFDAELIELRHRAPSENKLAAIKILRKTTGGGIDIHIACDATQWSARRIQSWQMVFRVWVALACTSQWRGKNRGPL